MLILVIAADRERRDSIVRRIAARGSDVASCHPRRASLAVRELRPAALVLDVTDPDGTRRALARARAAAEAPLPALLLVGAESAWAHAPLPAELLPAATADRAAPPAVLTSALRRFGLDAPRGLAESPAGYAAAVLGGVAPPRLTPSEARLYDALVEQAGEAAPVAVLAQVVWGDASLDAHRRAALRAHVHQLRRKLVAAGVPAQLRASPGRGYRLVLVTAEGAAPA